MPFSEPVDHRTLLEIIFLHVRTVRIFDEMTSLSLFIQSNLLQYKEIVCNEKATLRPEKNLQKPLYIPEILYFCNPLKKESRTLIYCCETVR